MNSFLDIPKVNPVAFPAVDDPGYKNFDNSWFSEQIFSWEQQINYFQKWVTDDVITLQFLTDFDNPVVQLVNCQGKVLSTWPPAKKDTNLIGVDFSVYEVDISLLDREVDEVFYILITVGTGEEQLQRISEPQTILESETETVVFEYWNDINDFDVIFDTGVSFRFRCEAIITQLDPLSKDTLWEDQILNLRVLSSKPYRQFKLKIGGSYGVPDWVIDKINRVFSCTTKYLNGIEYTKADGAKFEPNQAEYYPMRGWSVDIRETEISYSYRSRITRVLRANEGEALSTQRNRLLKVR